MRGAKVYFAPDFEPAEWRAEVSGLDALERYARAFDQISAEQDAHYSWQHKRRASTDGHPPPGVDSCLRPTLAYTAGR